jgi:hypothetical protein
MSTVCRARRRVYAVMAMLCVAVQALHGIAIAGQSRASFPVTVTVLAVARMELLEQAPSLNITAADIRRGYVDIADATVVAVKTNSPAGFVLDVHALAGLFKGVRLRYAGREVDFGAEGGSLTQRAAAPGSRTMQLSYRFMLIENLQPGNYPWPLLLSARPL